MKILLVSLLMTAPVLAHPELHIHDHDHEENAIEQVVVHNE